MKRQLKLALVAEPTGPPQPQPMRVAIETASRVWERLDSGQREQVVVALGKLFAKAVAIPPAKRAADRRAPVIATAGEAGHE